MDGVQALIFKAGHRPATSWANAYTDQLILRKISKIGATRKATIRFPLGLCRRPRWGSLLRSPAPLAVFKGPTSKGREGKRRGEEGKRKVGEVKSGEGCPQLASLDPVAEEGREGEKGK